MIIAVILAEDAYIKLWVHCVMAGCADAADAGRQGDEAAV